MYSSNVVGGPNVPTANIKKLILQLVTRQSTVYRQYRVTGYTIIIIIIKNNNNNNAVNLTQCSNTMHAILIVWLT